ncbi:MAG TPA: sporulation protein YqfD [Syntrophomonadaceae bacterium]|nr:sporulation protein YqfD [Syntrophomonadaceae bacterium]
MVLRSFWAYMLGYLVLAVRGEHPERFINLALTRGVLLWDLVRVDSEVLLVKVYARSFRSLRHIARRARCRLGIRAKRGLPFLIHRLRRRRMLVGGGVLFCLLVYFLCSFVWTVNVVGTRRVSPALVKRMAAAAGLRPGVLRYQVSGRDVADYLMQQIPGVAFAEVDVRARSRIKIVERVVPKRENTPCDIIANKDGMIENLLVLSGTPRVKEGDIVKRGDVVISGIIRPPVPEAKRGDAPQPSAIRYVAAKGIVRARIWYRCYGEAFRSELEELKTGRATKIICIKMDQKEIIIKGPREIPYRFYKLRVRRLKIPEWRDITFPVEFVTIEAEEIRRVRVHRSDDEALRLATQQACRKMAQRLPAGVPVVRRYLKLVNDGDANLVRVVLTVETVEDIGISRKLQPKQGRGVSDQPEQTLEGLTGG